MDHIVPIRLRPDLRLVETNVRAACFRCNQAKARSDARQYPRGAEGRPLLRDGGGRGVERLLEAPR
jgi:5-methylcytosine-specific restriction endonuclease McrA